MLDLSLLTSIIKLRASRYDFNSKNGKSGVADESFLTSRKYYQKHLKFGGQLDVLALGFHDDA